MGKKKEDLNEETRLLFERLAEISRELGYGKLDISHGVRSSEEQAAIKERAEKEGFIAAEPGSSVHEYGNAIDLFFNVPEKENQFNKERLKKIREVYNERFSDIPPGRLIVGDEGHFQTKTLKESKQLLEYKKEKESESMKKRKFIERPTPLSQRDFKKLLPERPSLDPRELLVSTNEEDARQVEADLIKKAQESAIEAEAISEVKSQVDQSSQNLQETIPQGLNTERAPASKSDEGISKDAKDALMFFAPQALGLVLGAVFEGTQGAIQGAEQAGKLRDAYNDFKFKQLEVEQRLADAKQNFQIVTDFGDELGRPITFDKTTRRFFNADGNPLDTSKIRNLKNERSQQFAMLQRQNLQMKQQQMGQLSDKQVETFAAGETLDRMTNRIEELVNIVDTGPLSGRWQSSLAEIGVASPEFVELSSYTDNLVSQFTKFLSGAQVSEPEAKRIAAILPTKNDSPDTFRAKLKAFQKYLADHKASIINSIQTGQPLRSDAVQRMIADAEKIKSGASLGKRESLMSDEQRRRLQQLRSKYKQ